MNAMNHLLEKKRWVYFLDTTMAAPDDNMRPSAPKQFRVCIVIEGEPGFYPTGDRSKQQEPWFWTEAQCEEENEKRGFSKLDAAKIVASSMAVQMRGRRR